MASRRLAETPQTRPMLIVGGRGEGKTHLLHAIAHRRSAAAADDAASGEVRVLNGDVLRESMRERQWADLSAQFTGDAVLSGAMVVDRLEAVLDAPRRALAERMIQRLAEHGRIIAVAVSDEKEADLRLHWAERLLGDELEVVRLDSCDCALRGALLSALAQESRPDLGVDPAALTVLAERLKASPREISSAYHRLCAHADIERRRVTRDYARASLSQLGCPVSPAPTLGEIVAATARRRGVSEAEIRSFERRPALNKARRLVMYLAERMTEESLASIGAAVGGRGEDLVRAARDWVRSARLHDGELDRDVEALRAELSR